MSDDLVDFFRQHQAVGRQAERHLGKGLAHQPEGLERLRIGQRIARPGNADDFQLRATLPSHVALNQAHPLDRLLRCQDATGDTGTALVGAIEPALAETALDVAARSDGQMNAPRLAVIAAEAGVIGLHLLFHHRTACSHVVLSFSTKKGAPAFTGSALAPK